MERSVDWLGSGCGCPRISRSSWPARSPNPRLRRSLLTRERQGPQLLRFRPLQHSDRNEELFYLKAGGGTTKYGSNCPTRPDHPLCQQRPRCSGGAGFRVGITPTLMTRASSNSTGTRAAARNLTNFGANLGLSVMLGSKPIADDDGDGIQNNRDRCPDTPRAPRSMAGAARVTKTGTACPTASTAARAPPPEPQSMTAGCPKDSDGDNIPDGIDRCPDTPAGVLVDPNGCAKDSDGDGIPDGLDRCSDTPHGATVDALGCPGDEDGDGVLDGLDRCPRTPAGARCKPNGCIAGQAPGQPAPSVAPAPAAPDTTAARRAETHRADSASAPTPGQAPPAQAPRRLHARHRPAPRQDRRRRHPGRGLRSRHGQAVAGSYVALDSVAAILIADPAATVEVSAHTDNSISAAESMRLTGLQADAVRDYLVLEGSALPAGRRQKATARRSRGRRIPRRDGRAANRRVEIRPVTPGP